MGDWGDDSEFDNVVWGLLKLVAVVNGYFPLGVLDRGNAGISTDCISTRHVSYMCIKGMGMGLCEGKHNMGCQCGRGY